MDVYSILFILHTFRSVYPPHGQWPAPIGSWRVLHFPLPPEQLLYCIHSTPTSFNINKDMIFFIMIWMKYHSVLLKDSIEVGRDFELHFLCIVWSIQE